MLVQDRRYHSPRLETGRSVESLKGGEGMLGMPACRMGKDKLVV